MGLIDADYLHSLPLGLKGPKAFPDADRLEVLIETASTAVEDFCERRFLSQTHIETLRGKDSYRLILGEYPMTALTSVTWEDDTTGSTGTVDTSLLRFDESGIIEFKRRGGINAGAYYANLDWFDRSRLYTVTYVAGYSAAEMPGPIKHAVALQVTELLQPNYGGPQAEVPELVPLSSQLIVDLLDPKYKRKMKRA